MEIDWENSVIIQQNNKESQEILEDNHVKLAYQCRLVLNILKTGRRLTVGDAASGLYDEWEKKKLVRIGDFRARIRDIRVHMEVKDRKFDGGFKEYFL